MNAPSGFLLLSVCSIFSWSLSSGCFRVNSCKCIMKDGSGVINLKAAGDAEGFLERRRPLPAQNLPAGAEVFLTYSPCQPFSQQEDRTAAECSSVAVCVLIRSNMSNGFLNRYIGYGRHDGNEFNYNHSLRTLSVSYYSAAQQPWTVVHYHCNPNRSRSFIRDQSLSAAPPLQIWVESPCACPNSCAMGDLGLGTIFLITLSISAAAYFILGSCSLRSFRSGSGFQIFPESSMWCRICYLCADRKNLRPPDSLSETGSCSALEPDRRSRF